MKPIFFIILLLFAVVGKSMEGSTEKVAFTVYDGTNADQCDWKQLEEGTYKFNTHISKEEIGSVFGITKDFVFKDRKKVMVASKDGKYLAHLFFEKQEDHLYRVSVGGFQGDKTLLFPILDEFVERVQNFDEGKNRLCCSLKPDQLKGFKPMLDHCHFEEDKSMAVDPAEMKAIYHLDTTDFLWFVRKVPSK